MKNIKAIFTALTLGRQLAKSATWKSVQGATNLVVALLAFVLTFFPSLQLSAEALQQISLAIAYAGNVLVTHGVVQPEMVKTWIAGVAVLVWSFFNSYYTYATSKSVGIPLPDSQPDAQPINGLPASTGKSGQQDLPVQTENSLNGGRDLLSGK